METIIRENVRRYRAAEKKKLLCKSSSDERYVGDDFKLKYSQQQIEENEEETRFNSALSTLLAENSWKLVTTRSGRYKVQFKSTLDYKDRVNILEIVLGDIRERYLDLKDNLQRSKRNYRKHKKRKRKHRMRGM